MPAREVMNLYRQHKLHSGPGGPVVKSKKQATAIQISMARKEGHHIPEVKGSFQSGGLVPETGDYQVHRGEQIKDIAGKTREAEAQEYRAAMQQRRPPWELMKGAPPAASDPHYAVEGLKGAVAERMRQQGNRLTERPATGKIEPATIHGFREPSPFGGLHGSFKRGGTIPRTGIYRLHRGEEVVPAGLAKQYRKAKHGG